MTYDPDRMERLWRGLLVREPATARVLDEARSTIDFKRDPELAFLRAFDLLLDKEKEAAFQQELARGRARKRVPIRPSDGFNS